MQDVDGTDAREPSASTSAAERQAILAAVPGALTDAVIVTDRLGAVIDWNHAAEALYGISGSDAAGRDVHDLLETTLMGLSVTPDAASAIAQRRAPWHGRVIDRPRIGRFPGRETLVEVTTTEIRRPDDSVVGHVAVGRAVALAARLERELEELHTLPTEPTDDGAGGVAQRAMAMLREATDAVFATIVAVGDEGVGVLAESELPPSIREALESPESVPAVTALSTSRLVVSMQPDAMPLRPQTKAALAEAGIGWVALAGIHLASGATGVLGLGWSRPPDAPPSEALMARTASEIARAIDNRRLVEEIGRRLEAERRMATRLEALVGLALVPAAADVAEAARLLLVELVSTLGASAGLIATERDGMFRTIADHGAIERLPGLESRPVESYSAWRRFSAGERAFLQPYVAGAVSPEALAESQAAGFTAYACFPIHADGTLWGVAAVFFDQPLDRVMLDTRTLDAITRIVDDSLASMRLRQRLMASENRYRMLFLASPAPYFLVDPERRTVVEANEPAGRLYGESAEALVGREVEGFTDLSTEDVARIGHELESTGRTTFRTAGIRADGTRFPMEVVSARLWIEGEPRDLSLVRNLTDEVRLQAELVQAQKMEAIGQLVSGVAHELNNPLAAIIAFSQLIVRDPRLPADLKHDAGLLVQESDRTRRIVQNLLDFARQRPPERHPTSIRALVQSVLDLQAYAISSARIDVRLELADDLPTVPLDRAQMQQVLLNITNNAVHAMRTTDGRGTLLIGGRLVTRAGERFVRLSITDDGPGVAAEHRDRLFVPFFTTKSPGEGTGLGLPVSFGIVAAHGGTMQYEPGPDGRGATFVIELPAAGAEVAAAPGMADSLPTAGTDAASQAAGSERPRILVLDDEPSIRRFLAKALEGAGYEPVLAGEGAEALAILRATTVDGILCDHRMAGMSGTEVYDAVVELRPELARRFVFMSGDVLNPALRDFAADHHVVLLAKPFDLETVARTVRQVLAGEPSPDQLRG